MACRLQRFSARWVTPSSVNPFESSMSFSLTSFNPKLTMPRIAFAGQAGSKRTASRRPMRSAVSWSPLKKGKEEDEDVEAASQEAADEDEDDLMGDAGAIIHEGHENEIKAGANFQATRNS
eukprot:scaffold234937_cov52-Prasinocladus_malaysianus.AAC.1